MNDVLQSNLISGKRLYFLDNLRSFIILVVVVFHVAMAFMVFCPEWWPVADPQQNLFFTGLVLLVDVPIMPIMFMIAGYFGIASLTAKGPAVFCQDKLLRIVLPWVLGFLFIAPWSPFLWLVSHNYHVPFSYFYVEMFFTKKFTTQGALWFLGALTVFYLVLLLTHSAFKTVGRRAETPRRPGWFFFVLFLAISIAVFVAINQFWYDFAWVPVKYILWVQPTRISLEAFYFALGVCAYRQRWFAAGGYVPNYAIHLPLAVLSGAALLAYKLHVGFLMPQFSVRLGHAVLHCVFCLTASFALFGLFGKYLNHTSALFSGLAKNSYAIYVVHMPIVLLANLAIRGYHWNIYVKYGVASLLSLVFSYLAAKYALGWLPMFNERHSENLQKAVAVSAD